jgi:hypothetical protein
MIGWLRRLFKPAPIVEWPEAWAFDVAWGRALDETPLLDARRAEFDRPSTAILHDWHDVEPLMSDAEPCACSCHKRQRCSKCPK